METNPLVLELQTSTWFCSKSAFLTPSYLPRSIKLPLIILDVLESLCGHLLLRIFHFCFLRSGDKMKMQGLSNAANCSLAD